MLKQPTHEQQMAINSDAHKIAISASAGSGKTTTMIERIARIIQMEHSRLDQLLVLTFTEESAKDMRRKLKKQLGNQVTPVELQSAAIGTFHSFCANIVRAWFSVAGVSPSFMVMDEIESLKLKTAVFEQVVADHYTQTKAAVDLFAAGRTLDGLRATMMQINEFLTTRRDPEQWLREVALCCYDPDVNHNLAVQGLINHYHEQARCYRAAFCSLQHRSPQIDFVLQITDQILQAQTYADFQTLGDLAFPKVVKEDFPAYADFVELRTSFRDDVCKKLVQQFRYPLTQLKKDIVMDRHIVEQLLSLVHHFDAAYQAKKTEYHKLDFADLEKYALKVLENPEAVSSIRGQYRYIFVDEGQDTNPVQFKIIDLLRGDDKFFYIVGDVKQSIYGFRDCEPELFEAMTTEQLIQALHFNKNFRSTNPILQFVNQVMQPLMVDYESKHKFILDQSATPTAVQKAVQIELAENLDAQMELVYQHIVAAKRPLNEIAILAETGNHFVELQKYLGARGIPSVIDRATDALQEPTIMLLNQFLFAALNPTNELARYLTLQYLFNFSNDDLAHLRLGQLTPALQKRLAQCEVVLDEYRGYIRTQGTYEVMTMAATRFGMLELPEVDAFLTAIRNVNDFDTVARYLYLLEHNLIEIKINVGAKANDAVKIMTIHHSKGLEFPSVILFDMGALWSRNHDNHKIALDKRLGVCVLSVDTEQYVQKSPVLRLGILAQQRAKNVAEKQRLLYVALTRAKDHLYIVGTWQRNPWRMRPNCMLDLINPLAAVERKNVLPSPEKVVVATNHQMQFSVPRQVGCPDVLVKQSVTALATAVEPFQDYVAPVKYDDQGGKAFGTAFHQQVQYGALPELVQQLVAGYDLYKELPFLYLQDQTIVQGIMDLLAVRGQQAIIVDYKTTRLPVEQLVAKYREQLRLYAQALPGYQIETYIYSTVHKRLIAVK